MNERIADLEMKLSLTEDTLDELNRTVFRQQQQIDTLVRELRGLREQMQSARLETPPNLRDEIPPHY